LVSSRLLTTKMRLCWQAGMAARWPADCSIAFAHASLVLVDCQNWSRQDGPQAGHGDNWEWKTRMVGV
jgi:hypothetical protein